LLAGEDHTDFGVLDVTECQVAGIVHVLEVAGMSGYEVS
jgi:hypothetical protein